MADEPDDHANPDAGRGAGIAMIAGGAAVLALALVFIPATSHWFGYATAAAVAAVGIALVIGGAAIVRRARSGRA